MHKPVTTAQTQHHLAVFRMHEIGGILWARLPHPLLQARDKLAQLRMPAHAEADELAQVQALLGLSFCWQLHLWTISCCMCAAQFLPRVHEHVHVRLGHLTH